MSESPTRIVQGFYEALSKGDGVAALALLHPDVQWTEAERFPYYSGTWLGPKAVEANLLARLVEDWQDFSAVAEDFVVEGDRVVSFGSYRGTYRATGRSMIAPFAHLWTVRSGRIATFRMYTDTAKVLEALHL